MLLPLDEAAVRGAGAQACGATRSRRVAIGLLHAYAHDGARAAHRATSSPKLLPGVPISLSSEVSPEIREYERFSTTVANAYVQPLMARLSRPAATALRSDGLRLPAVPDDVGRRADDARDRGALSRSAWSNRVRPAAPSWPRTSPRECGLDKVLSFDMGGTTAKICLIDDGEPQRARSFEVARQLPLHARAAACRCASR